MDNCDVRKASFEEVNAKLDAILGVMDDNITLISDNSAQLEQLVDKTLRLEDAAALLEDKTKVFCEQRSSMGGSMSDSWETIDDFSKHLPDDINKHAALMNELKDFIDKKNIVLDDPKDDSKTSGVLLGALSRSIEQKKVSTEAESNAPVERNTNGSLFFQGAAAASLGVCIAFLVNQSSQITGLAAHAKGSGYLLGVGLLGVGGAFIRQRFFSGRNMPDADARPEQQEKTSPGFS